MNSKPQRLYHDQKSKPSFLPIFSLRLTIVIFTILCSFCSGVLQNMVNQYWEYLRNSRIFCSVYFETWFATFCYAIILAVPFSMDKIKYFNKYKLDLRLQWQDAGMVLICYEAVIYMIPLMLLDTFLVKKYAGVNSDEWTIRKISWIQSTRALPNSAPLIGKVVMDLLLSFLLFDLFFFIVHVCLHKNRWLYDNIHALHHKHDVCHSRITNQLSLPERIILILSANESLKLCSAHPLTRMIFVPLFIAWLVDNHSGYDLPWSIDKVVPFQIVGGSRKHFSHHCDNSRYYAPFFNIWDHFLGQYECR